MKSNQEGKFGINKTAIYFGENMTSQYYLIYRVLMVLIIGTILAGCSAPTPPSDLTDKNSFTGIPCAAPCWHNLMVGKSNENEVMSTLPTLTFIAQNTVNIHRMSMPGLDASTYAPGAEITANCIRPDQNCLTIRVVDNILTEITSVMNYEIKLDEAIRYLGDPDFVGYDELSVEKIACTIFLVWKKKQLVLVSEQFDGYDAVKNNCRKIRDNREIASSLKISEVRYTSVATIEYILSNPETVFKFSEIVPK